MLPLQMSLGTGPKGCNYSWKAAWGGGAEPCPPRAWSFRSCLELALCGCLCQPRGSRRGAGLAVALGSAGVRQELGMDLRGGALEADLRERKGGWLLPRRSLGGGLAGRGRQPCWTGPHQTGQVKGSSPFAHQECSGWPQLRESELSYWLQRRPPAQLGSTGDPRNSLSPGGGAE